MEKLKPAVILKRLKVTKNGLNAYLHWSDGGYTRMKIQKVVTEQNPTPKRLTIHRP